MLSMRCVFSQWLIQVNMAAPWLHGNLSESIKEDPYFSSKSPLIVKDILSGTLTLVKFVEQLDGVLTDLSPDIRKRGTQVLSDILQGLPPDFLSEEALNFICTFYTFRLKDQHEVLPAVLDGILAVCNMNNIPTTSLFNICSTLCIHVNCQSQLRSDRLTIYQILNLVTTKHLQSVKIMGPDLVYGVISAIEGERDPRNLMFIFNMFPIFVKNMPPQHLAEEAFEVMACYFPVDFNPLSEDPAGITREDLSNSLAPCLTAIPEFAEYCLPLLLEKLDSELRLGKLDSLRLLEEASTRFNVESLSSHLSALWFSISREALRNGDREVREAAQNALMALLRKLGTTPVDSDGRQDQMRLLLGDVLSACTGALAEVQTSLFLPSSQLLVAAAKACSSSCHIVCKKVLPVLLSYFLEKNEPTEQVVLLQTMTILLSASQALQVTPKDFPELHADWKSISETYLLHCRHSDRGLQQEALQGLTVLLPSLEQDQVADLSETLVHLIDTEESFDTRDIMYTCLIKMAKLYPDEVRKNIVSRSMAREGCTDRAFQVRMLAMSRLATVDRFTCPILSSIINSIVTSSDDFFKVKACLGGLRYLLDTVHKDGETRDRIHNYLLSECSLVAKLSNWWISGMCSIKVADIFCDFSTLETISLILAQITCHQIAEEQQQNLDILERFFSDPNFTPLSAESPVHQTRTVCLLESVLGTLRLSVEIPNNVEVFHRILILGLKTNDVYTRTSALRLCASLVNKSANEESVTNMLCVATNELDLALKSEDASVKLKATAALSWIVKALVMRGHKDADVWTNKILELLAVPTQDPELPGDGQHLLSSDPVSDLATSVGYQAAKAFNIVMQDSPVFLNAHSHCHVKILYKQRFFQVAPLLASGFSSAPDTIRTNYLVALAYLLQGVPKAVLTTNLPQIIPLLLESLAKSETLLLLAVLNTLEGLLAEKVHHETLSSHLQTLLPRLLPLTVSPQPMAVRVAALRCLRELSSFPLPLILPFKDEVVNDLKCCLDDSKRLVRKEAVKTRSHWILCEALENK